MLRPIASLWSVFSLGFLVLPDIIFSTVDCVMPDKVAKYRRFVKKILTVHGWQQKENMID